MKKILLISMMPLFFFVSCMTAKPVIAGTETEAFFDSVKYSQTDRIALVLGGGGAKGSYEIGVYRALRELNYPLHIVAGTSVGALNGMFVVTGNLSGAEELWRTVDEDMVFSNPDKVKLPKNSAKSNDIALLLRDFVAGSPAKYEPLKNLIKKNYDAQAFYASPIDFGTIVVDLKTFKSKTIIKEDIAPDLLVDYMLASAACYPVFEPYTVDGTAFIDGGYADNIPLDIARQLGATKYIAVGLEAPGNLSGESKELIKDPATMYITPYWDLGSIMYFNPQNAERNMRLGYLDAMKEFGVYEGRAYAFAGDSFQSMNSRNTQFSRLAFYPGCFQALNIHWSGAFSLDTFMLTCAELAAEFFGMDPLQLYLADLFNAELAERIKTSKTVTDTLKDAHSIKIIFDLVEVFSESGIENLPESRILLPHVTAAAKKNPKELFAALYVYLAGLNK